LAKWSIQEELIPVFKKHESIRSISTPPWMDANSIAGLPLNMKFTATHLYGGVERGIVREKCCIHKHNTMIPAMNQTKTA